MNKLIVYNAEPLGYSEEAVEIWTDKGYHYQAGSWEEVDRSKDFPNVAILIVRLQRKIKSEYLRKFPDLRVLVSATTGHDHLDLQALQQANIKLLSLRGHDDFLQTIPSTAEHTWALLMSLIRKIPAAHEHVKSGKWNRDIFRGYQLKGKSIGIIGYGRTGQKVADYAEVFGVKVQFFDPYITNGNSNSHIQVFDLNDLLCSSDIITLHVHLNEETRNLLNEKNIPMIKQGAYLINTSRGGVWEEKSIANAVLEGKIGGVGTDVLEMELEDIKKSPLWEASQISDQIIITPHIGGATYDAMWECEKYISKIG